MNKSTRCTVVLLGCLYTPTLAHAWTTEGYPGCVPAGRCLSASARHEFVVDCGPGAQGLPGALTWNEPVSPSCYDIVRATSQALAYWNATARENVGLHVNPSVSVDRTSPSQPSLAVANGVNEVLFNTSSQPFARAYAACLPPDPVLRPKGECDIVFYTGTANTVSFLIDNDDFLADGREDPALSRRLFQRLIAHEFGHAMGLGDLESALHPSQNWRCDSGQEGPLMCWGGRRTDQPSVDDIVGARAQFGVFQRDIQVVGGAVAGSSVTWSEDARTADTWVSVVRPRIACRPGTNTPDCVVARAANSNCGNATDCIELRGVWTTGSGWVANPQVNIVLDNGSVHEVDVAMSDAPRAVSVRLDKADLNVWWASWNVGSPGSVTQGTLGRLPAEGGGTATTRVPPRVAFHNTIGTAGRFVIVSLDPDHRLRAAISLDATGTGFFTSALIPWPDDHRTFGQFDFSCPTHNNETQCRVVFNDLFESPGSAGNAANAAKRKTAVMECTFGVVLGSGGQPLLTPTNCQTTFGTPAIAVASVSDYGNNASGGQPGPAYLLSVGFKNPLAATQTRNVFNDAPVSGFPWFDRDGLSNPVGVAQPNDALWGGMSCDFVEWSHRFACVEVKGNGPW